LSSVVIPAQHWRVHLRGCDLGIGFRIRPMHRDVERRRPPLPERRDPPTGVRVVAAVPRVGSGAMAPTAELPVFQELMWPTVVALRRLGGSAPTEAISEAVIEAAGFTDDQEQVTGDLEDRMAAIVYQLAWARTYLKNIGAIELSARGVWSLAALGRSLTQDEIPGLVGEYKHRCSL